MSWNVRIGNAYARLDVLLEAGADKERPPLYANVTRRLLVAIGEIQVGAAGLRREDEGNGGACPGIGVLHVGAQASAAPVAACRGHGHGKSTFQPKPLQPTLKRPSDARLVGPPLLDLLRLGQSRRDSRSGSFIKNPWRMSSRLLSWLGG